MKLAVMARQYVKQFIDVPIVENEPYTKIAKLLSERKDVLMDIDIKEKENAKAFIIAFAHRHGLERQRKTVSKQVIL